MSDRAKVLENFVKYADETAEKVNYGIEHYRKGDFTLTILDENGNPVKNAKVKLNQKRHEFKFGANLFMLDELETDEKNAKYKEFFKDVFNMATLPFYWNALEPSQGKPRYDKDSPKVYRRPSPSLCIEYCEKYGIEPREHALAYDQFFPQWLEDKSVEECKYYLEKRFRECAEHYADKIPTIEVTNEMEWEKGKTTFYEAPDYIEWCFKTARKYFPNNELGINEHTGLAWEDRGRTSDKYYSYIEANMFKGAPIDAIGLQFHAFHKRELEYENTRLIYDPRNLYKHMDMYARFGKPLQITEITVPSYSWEEEDERIQAEIITQLYKIWFSHPAVEQIVYWNTVDGYAHVWSGDRKEIRASQGDMTLGENYYHGGLLRFDMTPKPAYYAIKDLLYKEWHTEAEAVTDDNGKFSFRGFYGDYDVEMDGKTYPIKASKNLSQEITLTK